MLTKTKLLTEYQSRRASTEDGGVLGSWAYLVPIDKIR